MLSVCFKISQFVFCDRIMHCSSIIRFKWQWWITNGTRTPSRTTQSIGVPSFPLCCKDKSSFWPTAYHWLMHLLLWVPSWFVSVICFVFGWGVIIHTDTLCWSQSVSHICSVLALLLCCCCPLMFWSITVITEGLMLVMFSHDVSYFLFCSSHLLFSFSLLFLVHSAQNVFGLKCGSFHLLHYSFPTFLLMVLCALKLSAW